MKIALAHFRVGETDGVSLEMEKWKTTFERMGHEVIMLAGSEGQSEAYVIDEMHYKHPKNLKFVTNAYDELKDYDDAEELKQEMLAFAEMMEGKLVDFLKQEEIDLLVPNNILSLGWNLPAGVAFTNAIAATEVQTICHHHDFHWEREKYENPTASFITDWLERYFPPVAENISHVVINSIAQNELQQRYGVESTIVPNVFDFTQGTWEVDHYNADFRETFDIEEEDILVLQATRVAERKAIELGIDFVAGLQRILNGGETLYNGKAAGNIVYVLAGLEEAEPEYIEKLKYKAENQNVDMRWINDRIDHSRYELNGTKMYSLWDAYAASDFITYPSVLEGWGNQLLEAMFAKRPIAVYEYPVFEQDLKDSGLLYPSFGARHTLTADNLVHIQPEVMKKAISESYDILTSSAHYQDVAETNFEIGKEKYSYEALYEYLQSLIVQKKEKEFFEN